MPQRPYSFKYSWPIEEVLTPWRKALGNEYEQVVSLLNERDRELENHINFRMGQGYLDINTDTGFVLITSVDMELVDLTLTIPVPDNRLLRGTVKFNVLNNYGVTARCEVEVTRNGVVIARYNSASMPAGTDTSVSFSYFDTPGRGTHIYRVLVTDTTGAHTSMEIFGSATDPMRHSIEDVGPEL